MGTEKKDLAEGIQYSIQQRVKETQCSSLLIKQHREGDRKPPVAFVALGAFLFSVHYWGAL